jgi:hypothetical protein
MTKTSQPRFSMGAGQKKRSKKMQKTVDTPLAL